MTHQDWQDMLPFYVAQTLSIDDKRRFEAHLADCERCQAELAEWETIAGAVWREADEVAQSLPPLSQDVYNRLSYRDSTPASRFSSNPPRPSRTANESNRVQERPRTSDTQRNRRSRLPLALVAGVALFVFVGSLVAYLNRPVADPNEPEIVLSPAGETIVDDNDSAIPDFGSGNTTNTPTIPTVDSAASSANEAAASQMQPEATATPTAILEPTVTNTPTATEADKSSSRDTGANPNGCIGTNTSAEPVPVVANNTGGNSEVYTQLLPGDAAWIYVIATDEWYNVFVDNGTIIGFVRADQLERSGDCSAALSGNPINFIPSVPTPLPEATTSANTEAEIRTSITFPDVPTVVVISTTFADLHSGPDSETDIITTVGRDEQFDVTGYSGTGENRWVRVRYELQDGWILASNVEEYLAGEEP